MFGNKFSKLGFACVLASAFGISANASTVNVDLDEEHQVIRGFGGMVHNQWQGGAGLSEDDAKLAFTNADGCLGLNTLRIPVYASSNDFNKEVNAAKYARKYAGNDFLFYATPWTSEFAGGNQHVASSNYQKYVDHLNDFSAYMKNQGIPLDAISISNEPDWCSEWACWSADEIYNFTKGYADQMRKNGTKVISTESFRYDKNLYNKVLNDANALKNWDILGAHFYASTAETANSFFQYELADQKGVERWMTEHYTESNNSANLWRSIAITGDQDIQAHKDTVRAMDVAYEVHRAMVEGNFNQYTWWYIKRSYGLIMGNNVSSIPSSEVGKITKRGYLLSQFSRFVRPGFVRVGATKNPDSHLYVSAYKNADSVVVVLVNRDWGKTKTVDISIPGMMGGASFTKYVTSETKNVKNEGEVAMKDGKVSVTLDKESVMTLVASAAFAPPTPRKAFKEHTIPGKIQAEDFDIPGTGAANKTYYDTDSDNQACIGENKTECSDYREGTGVDIYKKSFGNVVGYNRTGEWLEYTVNVAKTGDYTMFAYVASQNGTASFKLLMDGKDITSDLVVPKTVTSEGIFDSFGKIQSNVSLTAGEHILRFEVTSDWLDVDYFTFVEGKDATDPEPASSSSGDNGSSSSGNVDVTPVVPGDNTQAIQPAKFQTVSASAEYGIYDMAGAFLGSVTAQNKVELRSKAASVVDRSGVYMVKSAGRVMRMSITK